MPKINAFVGCRLGSTRLKCKNLLLIDNKPLFTYLTNSALKSSRINNLYLNTDSNHIIKDFGGIKPSELQKTLTQSNFIYKENRIYEAYLPLKSLIGYREFRWDAVKEIRVKILKGSQLEIGDFQLIEFRGNPENPIQWKGIKI